MNNFIEIVVNNSAPTRPILASLLGQHLPRNLIPSGMIFNNNFIRLLLLTK